MRSVEEYVGAGNAWPAGAHALEDAVRARMVILAQVGVAPRVVHDYYAAGFHACLGLFEACRTHLGPFLAAIHHDHVEPLVGDCMEIFRMLKALGPLEIERAEFQCDIM